MSDLRSGPRHTAGLRALRVHLAVEEGELARYLGMALAGDPQWCVVAPPAAADVAIADADAPTPHGEPAAPRELPVLFLGGSRESRARLRANPAARLAFLGKPFNAAQLRSALLGLVLRGD